MSKSAEGGSGSPALLISSDSIRAHSQLTFETRDCLFVGSICCWSASTKVRCPLGAVPLALRIAARAARWAFSDAALHLLDPNPKNGE